MAAFTPPKPLVKEIEQNEKRIYRLRKLKLILDHNSSLSESERFSLVRDMSFIRDTCRGFNRKHGLNIDLP
jgi:hypothetical protein